MARHGATILGQLESEKLATTEFQAQVAPFLGSDLQRLGFFGIAGVESMASFAARVGKKNDPRVFGVFDTRANTIAAQTNPAQGNRLDIIAHEAGHAGVQRTTNLPSAPFGVGGGMDEGIIRQQTVDDPQRTKFARTQAALWLGQYSAKDQAAILNAANVLEAAAKARLRRLGSAMRAAPNRLGPR